MELIVKASQPYKVMVDKIEKLNEYVLGKKVFIFTDSNVDKLYGEKVQKIINCKSHRFVFKAGERQKNLKTIKKALVQMLKFNMTREDIVLALGGGVAGDMAGFCASIYMRGIKWINCPTTLLAMIDSSVGGKTGVDFNDGKNLVGSFYQPSLVLCDTSFLDTLPVKQFKNGMGEAVKYMVLDGFEFSEELVKHNIDEFILKCVGIKKDIVELDEKESGLRMLLNLGHTFGHAIEKAEHFKIQHGVAVAYGIKIATDVSKKLKMIDNNEADKIFALLNCSNLIQSIKFDHKMLEAIWQDKKRRENKINLVLPIKFGKCKIVEIEIEKLKELLGVKG